MRSLAVATHSAQRATHAANATRPIILCWGKTRKRVGSVSAVLLPHKGLHGTAPAAPCSPLAARRRASMPLAPRCKRRQARQRHRATARRRSETSARLT
jgi:hypothetical protein